MLRRWLAVLSILILAACGCSKAAMIDPGSTDDTSGWVIEKGEVSVREANPYLDVTSTALPRIQVQVDKYIPNKVLELTLTLVNNTAYVPRNVALAFDVPLENPDGMTDKGSDIPWNFRMINGGDPINPGGQSVVDVHLDISTSGLSFKYYVMALIGEDPLNEKFVYEENNDWYDFASEHPIRLASMNGESEAVGINGRFPMMSGNGRYIAAVKLPQDSAWFRIKDTWTGEITDIHCEIPGCPGCGCRVGWGVFDYEGKYFVYMAGQKQLREYLWLRNMETGETTLIEGSMDGSEIVAAFAVDISGDGTMVSYCCDDDPINMYSYFDLCTYNIVTGEKIQWANTDNEDCDTSINWDGTRLSYRRGYFVPDIKGGSASFGMDYHTAVRNGEIPFSSLSRNANVSIYCVYELRCLDLTTGEDRVLAEKQDDPPNYICDARMDWAGNWIIYKDQPDQFYSTFSNIYMAAFDGSGIIPVTSGSSEFKYFPFMSGDALYAGWDIFMGSGGIYATDFGAKWKAINVGMYPDNGV